MRYEVRMLASARRALRRLDKELQTRLTKAIDKLAGNPRPQGCSKIRGG
jgi:mRNA-degrading endonuclease RelE of RelBE toxin-antitoxin system